MSFHNRSRLAAAANVAVTIALCAGSARAQAPGPLPLPNPYHIDETFKLQIPPDAAQFGAMGAVKIGPDHNIYVFRRCGDTTCTGHDNVAPLTVFTQQGKLLRSAGAGMFVWPHGLAIMPDLSMWVTDAVSGTGVDKNNPGKGHQVFHLDRNAKVLVALGKAGVAGSDHDTFNAPSDALVAPSGDVFIADGHGPGTSARIVKFDKNGKYITEWGVHGSGPGQFEAPHAMAMDSRGRLFVADRLNNRIQIFDQDGKFLMEWKQFGKPSGLAIDKNDMLFVTDTQSTKGRVGFDNGIYIGSAKDGKVTGFIPKVKPVSTWQEEGPGHTNMEAIAVSPDGNSIFGGDSGLFTVIKFAKNK